MSMILDNFQIDGQLSLRQNPLGLALSVIEVSIKRELTVFINFCLKESLMGILQIAYMGFQKCL